MFPLAIAKKSGDIVRGTAADLISTAFQDTSYGGNIKALLNPLNDGPLPVDKFINSVAVTNPKLAIMANIGQGIAGTAPLLLAGGLPSIVQKATALGFSADMIKNVGQLATDYGTEVGKPKEEQDPAKIAQLQSDLIQTGIFAPLAAAHGAGDFVSSKVEPLNYASREASKIINDTSFQPPIEDANLKPLVNSAPANPENPYPEIQVTPANGAAEPQPAPQSEDAGQLPTEPAPTEEATPAPTATPEPPAGEKVVTVQRPDGSTYPASFGGQSYEKMGPNGENIPSIAVVKDGKWSHTILPANDIIFAGRFTG